MSIDYWHVLPQDKICKTSFFICFAPTPHTPISLERVIENSTEDDYSTPRLLSRRFHGFTMTCHSKTRNELANEPTNRRRVFTRSVFEDRLILTDRAIEREKPV